MSKTVQFKRGNANVSATYVGAQGEITVNTDNYTLNVHDGIRAGGYTILNANVSNIGNLSVTNQTIIGTSANTNITLSPNNANVVLTSNLVTPNIAINLYTVQSVNSGSSLTLPAQSDGANIDLNNTFSNIRFTTYDSTTNAPYTLVLNRDSDVVFPGYLKSSLGSAEIQFAGGQGLLMYANFDTGSTGISLNDTGTSDIFANVDLRLTTNYSGAGKQWLFGSNGTLTTTGNLSTANLSISHAVANNTVQVRTLTNSDLKLVATNGTYQSAIYLWANNQRMSFNTVSNAFDFNFNGQLSATDFTASKNSNVGYSFYAEGSGYSGFRHSSGPPDVITIVHEGNVFAGFYGNYTTQFYGNLVVSGDGETFGSFPDAYVQVYSNVDTYSQFVLQNINDGSDASTDVVVTADNGNDSTYYINMGILGSNHAVPDFFGDVRNYDDGYLIVVGNSATGGAANVGNLILGSTNGVVKTFVGNTAEANVVTVVTEFGLMPGANVTYSLGSETNQWQDLWVSNNTIYIGGVALTVDGSGNLTVNGNVVSGGDGSNYGNSNVASYLTTYTGNIAGNIVKNGYAWTFGTDGDLTLPPGGIITTPNDEFFKLQAKDNNSLLRNEIKLDPNNGTYMSVWSGELDASFSTSDWATASWVNEGGVGGAYFTNAEDLQDFWTTGIGSFVNSVEVSINGGTRTPVQYDGNNGGGFGVTLLTDAFPVSSPTTITSLTFYYRTQSKIEIDYDGGEILLDGQALNINLQTTNGLNLQSGQTLDIKNIGQQPVRIFTDNTTHTWEFDSGGSLTLPREGRITGIGDGGPAGDRYGYISWAGNTSGDGAGYNTMRLVPDSLGLEDADQYIILDPTSPGHIHIRAGGTQDNSQSNLYFGGENSYVLIGAGTNPPVTIAANNATWTFDSDGNLALPASGVLLVSGGITAGPIISSPAPYLSGFSSISAVSMSASGNITGNTGGFAIGYRDIPQVVFTSNATLALTDAGKHYFSSNSANVITVPNNATVSFNIGTAISIVQQGTANLTINPDGGVTMYLAGNATSSSRLLGNYGMATIMKVDTDTWFINGTGLT